MPAGRTLAEWLAYQQDLHPSAIDLGLERVRAVAARLELLPPAGRTVLVGGTNGKGSTASFLAAMAQAHGERVGLFTSPHLWRYQERITIDGLEVQDAPLCDAFEQIEAARGRESLTYFEFNALAALLLFRAGRVSTSVLEVGLGGRLDATNIVDADVAVLCSVGLDHLDWLGDTLEAIGAEKAGIFRAGRPVILGTAQMPSTVTSALTTLGNRSLVAEQDFSWLIHEDGTWDYHSDDFACAGLPAPALPGAIQYRNAAAALTAWTVLRAPRRPEPAALAAALRSVRLPGRLQIVRGAVEWVFDVAHNEAAAAVLAGELRARPVAGRTIVVLGMLEDKDVAAVGAQLAPLADHWLLCTLTGARALSGEQLRRRLGTLRAHAELAGEVEAATARALQLARPGDRVLVCGSFHTVGPALRARQLY
jgi:dihydrofolate synthase / folylpolyglutamate synthase